MTYEQTFKKISAEDSLIKGMPLEALYIRPLVYQIGVSMLIAEKNNLVLSIMPNKWAILVNDEKVLTAEQKQIFLDDIQQRRKLLFDNIIPDNTAIYERVPLIECRDKSEYLYYLYVTHNAKSLSFNMNEANVKLKTILNTW